MNWLREWRPGVEEEMKLDNVDSAVIDNWF